MSYLSQQLGSAAGMLLPFALCNWGIGRLGAGVLGGARALNFAKSVSMLESPLLTSAVTRSATAGFIYDFSLVSSEEGKSFWTERSKNGLAGAVAFGSLELGKLPFQHKPGSSLFNFEMRRHFGSGIFAGGMDALTRTALMDEQTRQALEKQGKSVGYRSFESIYNFTVIGGLLGLHSFARQPKAIPEAPPAKKSKRSSSKKAAAGNAEITPAGGLPEVQLQRKPELTVEQIAERERQAQEKAVQNAERNATRRERREKMKAAEQARKLEREELTQKAREAELVRKQHIREKQAEEARRRDEEKTREQQRIKDLRDNAEKSKLEQEQLKQKVKEEQARQEKDAAVRKLSEWKATNEAKDPQAIWENYKKQISKPQDPGNLNRGDKAQNELYEWTLKEHKFTGNEHPEITPLLKLRRQVQAEMKSGNWDLAQAGKNSLADSAGMDYLLVNKNDGRYFMFDATLDLKVKDNLPPLRLENVVKIELSKGADLNSPTNKTKFDFLNLLQQRMKEPSLLNLKDTPPPNLSSSLSVEQSLVELTKFREGLKSKCHYLDLEAKLNQPDSTHHQGDQSAERLRSYDLDLDRAERYVRVMERKNSADWILENRAFSSEVQKHLSQVLNTCFNNNGVKQRTDISRSGEVMLRDPSGRAFIYSINRDALLFYESSANHFETRGMNRMLHEAFASDKLVDLHSSRGDFYDLKRKLLAQGSTEHLSLMSMLLERLSHHTTNQLLGR